MTTIEFVSFLRGRAIKLWVEGEQLCYGAPQGALTPALRAELGARKAELIAFLRQASPDTNVLPIQPALRSQPLPLSFAQQRLWFLDQLVPGSATYIIPTPVRLNGALDLAALHASFTAIIRRHESLRTTFALRGEQPIQVIAAPTPLPLAVVDLQALPTAVRAALAERLTAAEAQQPFDLAGGPLVRTTLLRLMPQEHIVLLTMHHIISDGWSVGVLIRELAALYTASLTGQPAPLPDLPIQYADYAVWQQAQFQGAVLDAQLAYWTRQLAGAPPVLDLPLDRPRPPVQTFQGSQYMRVVPPPLLAALQALSQRTGATLFMTLLAIFQIGLARHSGQDDILVGSPIAGRTQRVTEGLIGFFINTLVLRTNLGGNPSFLTLLGRVREVCLSAYAHQELPFERLVEELQPERDLSRHPLFQVTFVLQNVPIAMLDVPGLTLYPIAVESPTAKFDLSFALNESAAGLSAAWEYNTNLFTAATITRLAGHFQTLLTEVVADPTRPVAMLPLLSAAERQQLLVEWEDTATADAADQCLQVLFERQVARAPDAVAVVFETECLTYQALNARANQLGHYLRAQGVGPEMLVGICMLRVLELLVAILGVLKAGGAYLLLDPDYPTERLAFMLDDSRATVLITTQDDRRRAMGDLGESDTPIVNRPSKIVHLDADWPMIASMRADNLATLTRPDHLAYVIYTSGSTGTPKGVLVTHRNLAHTTQARFAHYHDPITRFLLIASVAFDSSVAGLFWTLCQGGTLVIPPEQTRADPGGLIRMIQQHQISHMTWLPALYALVLDGALPIELRSLRTLIVAGEACPPALVTQHRQRLPQTGLFNEYGPTEGTVWSSVYACVASEARPVPIGRPIPNVQLYLLDAHMQPVPIGVTGEVYIGGSGITRGYLNRPKVTAERFMPNPFATTNDERRTTNDGTDARPVVLRPSSVVRLYRTGDLARYRPDGNLEFLGRRDTQVKLRGYRIELGEIEAMLRRHPDVRECVVSVREDIPGDQRLLAYVVPTADAGRGTQDDHRGTIERAPTTDELEPAPVLPDLRSFLQSRLPGYMVPATFMFLVSFPLTPNGKIDRAALPAPEGKQAAPNQVYIAPRTPLEATIAELTQQVLGCAPVGIHDNFFDLGGHSLLAVRLMARLRELTGVALSLATLFRHPTIAQLARVLRDQAAPAAPAALVGITTGGTNPPLFCIHPLGGNVLCYAQLARQLGPAQPVYGLQAPGLEHDQALPTTVESMAAEYVAAIRAFQPAGPYLLCGWSVGGVIAFEIAQQLTEQGQPVALLALLDSQASQPIRVRAPDDHWLLIGMAQQLGLNPDHAALQPLDAEQQLAAVLALAQRSDALLPGLDLAQLRRLFAVYKANAYALLGYRPRAYAGRVTLFQAHATAQVSDLAPGWRALARRGVASWAIPGDHDTMLQDPYVRVLADRLTAAIAQARLLSRTEERTR